VKLLSLALVVAGLGLSLILACFFMAVRKFGSVRRVRLILAAIWSLWVIRRAAIAQFRTMREKEATKDGHGTECGVLAENSGYTTGRGTEDTKTNS
jgi:hypothetical protein